MKRATWSVAGGCRAAVLGSLLLLAGCEESESARQDVDASLEEVPDVRHGAEATRQTAPPVPDTARVYVCPPCAPHDTLVFHEDGRCPVCGMALIEKPDSSRVGEVRIHAGSGNFLLPGGAGHEEKLITVFYHRPERFTPRSPILIVLPGSGRDANEYRDAWVPASDRYGVLVLSPMYTEEEYGFGDYHMGGLMYDLNLSESVHEVEGSNEVILDEERLDYRVNASPEAWIFGDFDRMFERVAEAMGSAREGYDLFGHSAGGQILHRLVLLHPDSEADRILAANSGFYTMPELDAELPFGVADAPVTEADLRRAFAERLVLFLGEEDDEDETGGILLRSPSADRQGAHRLARGRHFYATARGVADEMDADFRWRLEVVPGVGHDHQRMGEAAAEYLYGGDRGDGGDGGGGDGGSGDGGDQPDSRADTAARSPSGFASRPPAFHRGTRPSAPLPDRESPP